ncbi:hypothetical protein PQX77_014845 [Marasmius sp. AFHP31]|nr:hypothetical protein PQX77_014845 [Marasmius sp. AFHP31]
MPGEASEFWFRPTSAGAYYTKSNSYNSGIHFERLQQRETVEIKPSGMSDNGPIYEQAWFIIMISIAAIVLFLCLLVFAVARIRRGKTSSERPTPAGTATLTLQRTSSERTLTVTVPTLPHYKLDEPKKDSPDIV